MPQEEVADFLQRIRARSVSSWEEVHAFYTSSGHRYQDQKFLHALASLWEVTGINRREFTSQQFKELLNHAKETKEWLTENIFRSREKDYQNSFRQMVYDTAAEMDQVMGKLEENVFIRQQNQELQDFRSEITAVFKTFKI